jgi:hypothetical protein
MLNIFPQTLCSGDINPLTLTFTKNGAAYSLVGSTLSMTVKAEPEDSNDLTTALLWQDVVGDATGIVTFNVGPLAAGTYWLDVKKWLTGQTPTMRQTVIPPVQIKIIQSVTSRGV